MTHPCPWPECAAPIPASMFLCAEHWKALPLQDRCDMSAAFTRYHKAAAAALGDRVPRAIERLAEAGKHLRAVQARVLRTAVPALP